MKRSRFLSLLCLFTVLAVALALGRADAAQAPPYRFHTEWAKLSAMDGRRLSHPVDQNVDVAVLWLIPSAGYYTYGHEAGEEGMPLSVSVLADGAPLPQDAVQIQYPRGRESRSAGGAVSRHLYGPSPVFIIFRQHETRAVTLSISLLACSAQHCFPVRDTILLPAAPDSLPNAANAPWFAELEKSLSAQNTLPAPAQPSSTPDTAALSAHESASLPQTSPQANALRSQLLPEAHTSVFQKRAALAASPAVPRGDAAPKALTSAYGFTPETLEGAFRIDGWLRAVGLGILAGLLLNFMPCVLPVLTMKFSFLLNSGGTMAERRRSIRQHTVFFALGVVTWFALLALLSGLTGMLWGQLFQSTEVIFFMLLIVFCMSLSLFDVFHLPVLDLQPQNMASPRMHAFGTGMFTTLLATPCSGPLLGGVLAWGITKPLPVLMTVFAATGVGMALPYMVIACFPGLVRFLPKPGAWLSTMERILGLLLMATAIYLFSMLPADLHVKTLITLLVAATSAWIWGRWGSLRGSITRRMFLGAFAFGAIALSTFWAFLPPQQDSVPWVEFSEERFRADLGKKAMIVEFTADWCPTCKVLERTTLAAPNLLPILDQYSVMPVKVDMTAKNESHDELLKALDSASIPLLAVFPEGKGASRPVILRDIYTVTDLHLALRQAKIPHKRMVEMLYPVKLLTKP